jgi:hypothetical protein
MKANNHRKGAHEKGRGVEDQLGGQERDPRPASSSLHFSALR